MRWRAPAVWPKSGVGPRVTKRHTAVHSRQVFADEELLMVRGNHLRQGGGLDGQEPVRSADS